MPSAARVRATTTRRATWLGVADAGAFGGDEVVGLVGGLEADGVVEDVGELLEEGGELAQAGLPLGAVFHERCAGGESGVDGDERGVGGLFGEVGGGVFFFGADLLLGLDLEEAVEGAAVAAVGGVPERVRERGGVVGERQRNGGEGGVAMVPWVLSWASVAEADLDVGGCGGGTRCSSVRAPNCADMLTEVTSETA